MEGLFEYAVALSRAMVAVPLDQRPPQDVEGASAAPCYRDEREAGEP
jgi:hypothetical protein